MFCFSPLSSLKRTPKKLLKICTVGASLLHSLIYLSSPISPYPHHLAHVESIIYAQSSIGIPISLESAGIETLFKFEFRAISRILTTRAVSKTSLFLCEKFL